MKLIGQLKEQERMKTFSNHFEICEYLLTGKFSRRFSKFYFWLPKNENYERNLV